MRHLYRKQGGGLSNKGARVMKFKIVPLVWREGREPEAWPGGDAPDGYGVYLLPDLHEEASPHGLYVDEDLSRATMFLGDLVGAMGPDSARKPAGFVLGIAGHMARNRYMSPWAFNILGRPVRVTYGLLPHARDSDWIREGLRWVGVDWARQYVETWERKRGE